MPSWRKAARPIWVDALFQKYVLLSGGAPGRVTCLRRTPTDREQRLQCTSCYNRHRTTSVICLGNMPHAVSPMVPSMLYDIHTLDTLFNISNIREQTAKGRYALVTLQLGRP